ncbi:MAG TPA: pyridoxamine 5'-phosphate oxidase family protein [Mycobacteriales bacterium]|nr:pyridoxamine 5'-phosphate oxidase family protein [Mycobacteriales bacterium]
MEPIRSSAQRKADILARLENDVDAWVASTDQHGGLPYLIPLSFLWTEETLLFATAETTITGRNMDTTGRVRIALDGTRDVVLIDGTADSVPLDGLPAAIADAYAAKTGWEPREDPHNRYYRVRPTRIQAWREVNENPDATVLRDGRWLA